MEERKEKPNPNKMMAEGSWNPGFGGYKSDIFSHESGKEQTVSHLKPIICTEDNTKYLDGKYAPMDVATSVRCCKDNQKVRFPQRGEPHTRRMLNFICKQQNPCYGWTASTMSINEVLKLLPRHQRKTRWQLRQDDEAAITIQSAWRGWQVRKEIDKMDRAATQIQVAFRRYMARKELPLGLCCYGRKDWPTLKEKRVENKSRSCPLLNCVQRLGFTSGAQTESQSIFLPNNRQPICPRNISEGYPLLDPNVSFFGMKSAISSSRKVLAYASLKVFAPRIQNQKYQEAATTIQAAWRGYQIRQKARPMIQADKSLKSSPSNVIIDKTSWRRPQSGHTVEEHGIQQTVAKSTLTKLPQIRNINIYTVVKGMPASSQRPDISIQVQSPKAMVQGFQRDMSTGAKALYTVKNRSASRPSQILIHVNTLKGKDSPAKTEKKMQKQER